MPPKKSKKPRAAAKKPCFRKPRTAVNHGAKGINIKIDMSRKSIYPLYT